MEAKINDRADAKRETVCADDLELQELQELQEMHERAVFARVEARRRHRAEVREEARRAVGRRMMLGHATLLAMFSLSIATLHYVGVAGATGLAWGSLVIVFGCLFAARTCYRGRV